MIEGQTKGRHQPGNEICFAGWIHLRLRLIPRLADTDRVEKLTCDRDGDRQIVLAARDPSDLIVAGMYRNIRCGGVLCQIAADVSRKDGTIQSLSFSAATTPIGDASGPLTGANGWRLPSR